MECSTFNWVWTNWKDTLKGGLDYPETLGYFIYLI